MNKQQNACDVYMKLNYYHKKTTLHDQCSIPENNDNHYI